MKPFYMGQLKMKLRETLFLYGSIEILLYGPTKKNEIMTSFHFGPTEKWNWKKHLCMWHYLNKTDFAKQIWYLSEKLAIIIWQKLTIHQLRYTENAKKHYSSKMHRRRSRGIEYYDNSDLQKWWYVLSKRFELEYHHILLI